MDDYTKRRLIFAKYKGLCGYCLSRRAAHVHEIQARSAGGSLDEANRIPLCTRCHEIIHLGGWQNFTSILHNRQQRAHDTLNTDIVVGGNDGSIAGQPSKA